MTPTRPRSAAIWLLLSAVLACALSLTLRADEQEIIYSSDGGGSIETVDGIRITTLRGNVHIQQGNSQLWGDTAVLEQDPVSGDMIRARVRGSPARFEHQSGDSPELINGQSNSIDYFVQSQGDMLVTVIEFTGNASFSRGRTALECAEIRHILETAATESPGPCSGVLAPRETL